MALHVDLVHMEHGIDHRQVDVLADTGPFAVVERVAERGEAVDAATHVGDPQPDELRRAVRAAGHVHNAGERLGDEIVADSVRERTFAAERGDRHHDELGIPRLERGVVEPAFFHHARPEILHHHVHGRDQVVQDVERCGLVEIQTQAALAAVLLHEIGAAVVPDEWQQPRRIAHRRLFDLDDVGAHFGHEPGHRRPGKVLGKIQDGHVGEHGRLSVRLVHGRPPRGWSVRGLVPRGPPESETFARLPASPDANRAVTRPRGG